MDSLHYLNELHGLKNFIPGECCVCFQAVRSTHCLEVPLSHEGRLLVSQEYIEFLVRVANQKMEENIRRIDRFVRTPQLCS